MTSVQASVQQQRYDQRYYQRKAEGKCKKCPNPTVGGRTRGPVCQERYRGMRRRVRRQRKDEKVCRECGEPTTQTYYLPCATIINCLNRLLYYRRI